MLKAVECGRCTFLRGEFVFLKNCVQSLSVWEKRLNETRITTRQRQMDFGGLSVLSQGFCVSLLFIHFSLFQRKNVQQCCSHLMRCLFNVMLPHPPNNRVRPLPPHPQH